MRGPPPSVYYLYPIFTQYRIKSYLNTLPKNLFTLHQVKTVSVRRRRNYAAVKLCGAGGGGPKIRKTKFEAKISGPKIVAQCRNQFTAPNTILIHREKHTLP